MLQNKKNQARQRSLDTAKNATTAKNRLASNRFGLDLNPLDHMEVNEMHSGIYELQYRADEQRRQRPDHKAIALRDHQVSNRTARSRRFGSIGRVGRFASDVGFDFAAAVIILAVISLGAMLMGEVMSAKASVGDPVEIFQQPEDPRAEAPKGSIPDIDNGDKADDPVVEEEEDGSGRPPGQSAPVPAESRASMRARLGLPLSGLPGGMYLFANNGDDRDDPNGVVAQIPDINPSDPHDEQVVGNGSFDPGRGPGLNAPVPAVTRRDLGLPLTDDESVPGRWYLFAGHGDPKDAPTVD